MSSSISDIKRAQKESLLFREISQLFLVASQDDPKLADISISRVELSPDKGVCKVLFYTPNGAEWFEAERMPILKQYKSSLRKALASRVRSRYTPELVFAYDARLEKQMRLEALIDTVTDKD